MLLAGGADADCFDYCYKNCIANDRSMADYCNYACDKTCEPGVPLRPLVAAGGGGMGCQLSCARTSCNRLRADGKAVEACFGQCYDGCKTKTLPRPLRAGAGVATALGPVSEFPASEPDTDDAVRRPSGPDHPFHEKQEAVQPASEPDKDDALRPASEPKDDSVRLTSEPKDDAVRPGTVPDQPFHEKQDSIQPASEPRAASEPDADNSVRPACRLDRCFHEKPDSIHPASEPDKDDAGRPASEPRRDDAGRHDKDTVRPGPRGANPEIHVPPPAAAV